MVSLNDQSVEVRAAKQTQKIDDGIEVQRRVLAVRASEWFRLNEFLLKKGLLSPKEVGVLKIAMQIPTKLPTENQCVVLLNILGRGRAEGFVANG